MGGMEMQIKNRNILFVIFLFFLTTLILTNGCNSSGILVKSLPENDKIFLNEVSLIITKQERKKFLSLTNQKDREIFKKEFWEKRDPDPGTEENEFKTEYYNRMRYANKYFRNGKKSGWKTDRGRIYMILGPPSQRRFYQGKIYSRSGERPLDSYPHIVWLYGNFPVIFVDYFQINDFKISPISARQIGMLNTVGIMLKPKVSREKIPMDFNIKLNKKSKGKILLSLTIPFSTISFTPEEGGLYNTTTIGVTLKIVRMKTKKEIVKKREFKIRLTEKDLDDMSDNYTIKFPIDLKQGKYVMTVILKNHTDNKETRKKIKFAIKN